MSLMHIFLFITACAGGGHTKVNRPSLFTHSTGGVSFAVLMSPAGSVKFKTSTRRPGAADIFINGNFFNRGGPIGELIVGGKRVSAREKHGGYFFVKGGRAHVSAYSPPIHPEHSMQTVLVGINDGKVNRRLLKQRHARELEHRSLIGVNKDNDVIIIASQAFGLVTIKDIVDAARGLGVIEAILPDAGSSVDYRLSDGAQTKEFKSVPGIVKRLAGIEEPKSYVVGTIR